MKKEQEALAINYEQEEECLTNDLFRKLSQVCMFFFIVEVRLAFLCLLVLVIKNTGSPGKICTPSKFYLKKLIVL